MDRKLFKIGEISKLFNLSVSSIRHYEVLGLLEPEYTDPETGYRYYSTRQFEAFNSICYLRALDMPLDEISDFLKNRDVEVIEEKLRWQKETVSAKIAELKRIERKIDNRLRQLDDARRSKLDVMEIAEVPPCRIFWVEKPLTIHNFHDMEEPTIKLAEAQAEALIFLGKVGVGISEKNLKAGDFSSYDGIFLVLDDEDRFLANENGRIAELPQTLCASVRFCGCHTEAPERYKKLMRFIEEKGLEPAGFSREITLIDYGITNDTEKFVTEIRIPVLPK